MENQTLREFINEHASPCFVCFHFDYGGTHFYFYDIKEFITKYGTVNEPLLDDLVIYDYNVNGYSMDQGTDYYLKVMSKADYDKTYDIRTFTDYELVKIGKARLSKPERDQILNLLLGKKGK